MTDTNADTTTLFDVTEAAIGALRRVAAGEGVSLDDTYVRVAVAPGGCSGLTYDLGWDTTRRPDDVEVSIGGVAVLLDPRTRLHVEGTRLDFTDGLDGKGFHFHNPQATRTCACGESFGV